MPTETFAPTNVPTIRPIHAYPLQVRIAPSAYDFATIIIRSVEFQFFVIL